MGLINHVTRRQATYVWRRRVPAAAGTGSLQVSLCTTDPRAARRIATIVTMRSDAVFEDMMERRLTRAEAKALLDGVVQDELERAATYRAARVGRPTDDEATERREDVAHGLALRLLADGGMGAQLTDVARQQLAAEGYDAPLINHVGRCLDLQRKVEEAPAVMAKLTRRLTELLGEPPSELMLREARRLRMRGRSAALMATDKLATQESDLAAAAVEDVFSAVGEVGTSAGGLNHDSGLDSDQDPAASVQGSLSRKGISSDPLPAEPDVTDCKILKGPFLQDLPAYDPDLVALARSMAGRKQTRGRVTDRTAHQIEATARLFIEATGIRDVREVTQAHLARFVEVMAQLPPLYRKSAAERSMTLGQIIAAARRAGKPQGLSPATVNRNLGFLGQILKHARLQGIEVSDRLDLTNLREVDARDARDAVLPFSQDDLHRLFRSPAWTGSRSAARRLEPGTELIRDGLYWLPLLAAYTGARREELAGLLRGSVRQQNGIWVVEIAANAERRIKNATSKRTLPLHPHLVELGLPEFAAGPPGERLFPDLTRKSSRGNLGDSLQYRWQKLLTAELGDDAAGKKFHSFRHTMTDHLRRDPDVPEWVRRDILGHAATDVEDRVYGSRATPEIMLRAIEKLPRVM